MRRSVSTTLLLSFCFLPPTSSDSLSIKMSDPTPAQHPPANTASKDDDVAPGVNLERKARKEAQKALKAKQAADKKAAAQKASSSSSSSASAAAAAATSSQPKSASSSSKRKPQSAEEQLSRALAYILRHGAEKEGLSIRSDGFVPLQHVLERPRVKSVNMTQADSSSAARRPGLEDVKKIVQSNDKKRFELKQEDEEWLIRAVQGHSLKSVNEMDHVSLTLQNYRKILSTSDGNAEDEELEDELNSRLNLDEKEEEEKVQVIHGTNPTAWNEILSSGGLKVMNRNHIHLAKGKFGDKGVISGMRKSANRLIFIDIKKALEDGVEFVVSSNGVVLTEGEKGSGMLGVKYFMKVDDGKGNLIWENKQKQKQEDVLS